MKVAMLVVDRDVAFVFLDTNNAPEDVLQYDLALGGVPFSDIGSEELCVWLESPERKLTVVSRASYDFATVSDQCWSIPTPVVCLDKDDTAFVELQ
jgi:hypothetical protein